MGIHYHRDGRVTVTNDETGETQTLNRGAKQAQVDALAEELLPPTPALKRDALSELDALKATLVTKGVLTVQAVAELDAKL